MSVNSVLICKAVLLGQGRINCSTAADRLLDSEALIPRPPSEEHQVSGGTGFQVCEAIRQAEVTGRVGEKIHPAVESL